MKWIPALVVSLRGLNRKFSPGFFHIGMIAATLLVTFPACGQVYNWKSVAIKGGGFVSGIITHPGAAGLIYARTDIGGAYRWNQTNNSWIPLLDFAANDNIYGVESVAIDPSDTNRLYIASSRGSPAVLLVSTNQGATFSQFTPPFALNGNVDGRSNGERMRVDPNLNSILYYGSRTSGLYRSLNYGASWSSVASFPVTSTTNSVGLVYVEFIQSSGSPGSATPTIYVGISQASPNLYRSTNAGVSWAAVPTGAPANQMAHHAAQDGLGNMYLTFNDNQGPNNITTGSVVKLNLTTLGTSLVTPPKPSGAQGGFAGVSVDQQNPNTVVVSTMDRWYANPPAAPWDVVERSINGGATWVEVSPDVLPDATSAPWSVSQSPHWAGDVEIDPYNSNRVFFITGYGVIASTNLTAGSVNFKFMNDGLEETVPLSLASPPSGPFLLSAHGDIGAFRHFNLDASPPSGDFFSTHRGTSEGIDFAESNPNTIVRLFSGSPGSGCYSLNGGTTWADFSSNPGTASNGPGNIAISADGAHIVWIPQSSAPYFSSNKGATWTISTNGPTGNGAPISDRVNPVKFYIYSGTHMYVSTDAGSNFTASATVASGGGTPRTVFGREGDIWLPLNGNGLTHSTNSGVSFTALSGVQQASYVALGMAATGQSYPAVFIVGRANNDGSLGIYRSDNMGLSWTRINDSQHQFGLGNIQCFCADPRSFGRVYFGTQGRGIIYGAPGSQPPAAVTDLAATGGNSQISLTWSAVSGSDSYSVERSVISGGPYAVITNGLTATSYTDSGLTNGSTYYYVVAGTNAFGGAPDSNEAGATANPPQAFAYYPFEGNAFDTSGNGNNGIANAAGYVTGKIGAQAAFFNGSSAYVQIPPVVQNSFTVAMWVKTLDAGNTGTQWWQGKGLVDGEVAGATQDWGTALLAGKFSLGIGNPDTTVSSTVSINDGSWHHVAATRDTTSGAMNVYVDGILRGSGTGPTGGRTASPDLRIGSIQTGGGFLSGTIDDVRLFNQVLTASDIASLAIAPLAPTGLAAVAGDAQATLSWASAAQAYYYNIRQSTTSGGPYVVVATNVPGLSYMNTGLTNGIISYFVISAVDLAGESPNSGEVSALPVSAAPTMLSFAVVGSQLQLSWPPDHTGWQLQVQTNDLSTGVGTNWITVPGSALTNQFLATPDSANQAVFFRIVSP